MAYGNGDPKQVSLTAAFLDDKGQVVQSAIAPGPPTGAEYTMAGGTQPRLVTGFLLPGVTQVKLTIDFGAVPDSLNQYAADNLSLVLTRDPMTSANLVVNGDAEAETGEPVSAWNGPYDAIESAVYVPG